MSSSFFLPWSLSLSMELSSASFSYHSTAYSYFSSSSLNGFAKLVIIDSSMSCDLRTISNRLAGCGCSIGVGDKCLSDVGRRCDDGGMLMLLFTLVLGGFGWFAYTELSSSNAYSAEICDMLLNRICSNGFIISKFSSFSEGNYKA
jgi:hypothetical protein